MRIVPRLVPVAVENSAHTRKAAATKPPPRTPDSAAAQTSASTSPLSWSTVPSTPARSQARTRSITRRWLIPSTTASA